MYYVSFCLDVALKRLFNHFCRTGSRTNSLHYVKWCVNCWTGGASSWPGH